MPTPLILFDQVYNGEMRHALAAHSKQGWVYILDRVSGKPLIEIEEKPVPQEPRQKTVATQPIPAGDPTAPQCGEACQRLSSAAACSHQHWSDTKIAQPSASGDWAPGAYDPQSGYLFFATEVATRQFNLATRIPIEGTREYGLITALDSRTNKRVWQKRSPLSGRLRKRAAGYRRRADFPRRLRRFLSRLRFQDRRGTLAFPDRLRGGCTGRNLRD